MWETVHISQDKDAAMQIMNLLEKNKILVRYLEHADDNFVVLVPSTELEQAQELILFKGQH